MMDLSSGQSKKRMKQKVKNTWLAILGAILSLLGFGGCDEIIHFGAAEYGCPHADYKIVGEVTGEGKPIKGIRVALLVGPYGGNEYYGIDTLYTDSSGKIEKDLPSRTLDNSMLSVKLEDVDGPENGSWQTKTLGKNELVIKQTQKGDGKWYQGVFTVTANAELKKAED